MTFRMIEVALTSVFPDGHAEWTVYRASESRLPAVMHSARRLGRKNEAMGALSWIKVWMDAHPGVQSERAEPGAAAPGCSRTGTGSRTPPPI